MRAASESTRACAAKTSRSRPPRGRSARRRGHVNFALRLQQFRPVRPRRARSALALSPPEPLSLSLAAASRGFAAARAEEAKHKEKHKHKREKSSKRHRSDGESKLREKERLLARDRALLTEDPRRALPANFGGSSSAAFSYDTRGDRDNLAFECLFAGHVPSYRALLKASAAEREPPRYFRDWERAPPPAAASASDEPLTADWLRARVRRQLGDTDPLGDGADVVRFAEANGDDGDGGWHDGVGVDGALFARTRTLNEAVRLRPTDAAAWLALANFENDAALGGGGGGVRQGALAEKRLAVLRRAVEANPRHDELRLALLRAAEALLPPEPLAREWEEAVAALPGSVPIWVAAIGARARAFAAFTVGDVRELGARALASLGTALEQAAAAGAAVAELEGRERGMLLVALRLAHAERAAGYDERALAALVALAELNCFCPPALLHAPAADRIAPLRSFGKRRRRGLATPTPRAGRRGSTAAATPRGAGHRPGGGAEEADDAEETDEGGADAARRACWAWARREERLTRAGALPVASADEEAVEADPERVVIVDDVRRCLVVLRSPSVQAELLVELAAFAGLSAATPHVASAHPLAALRDATALAPEALLPPARAADDAVACRGGRAVAGRERRQRGARRVCSRSRAARLRALPADARLAALALAAAGRADAANGVRRAGRRAAQGAAGVAAAVARLRRRRGGGGQRGGGGARVRHRARARALGGTDAVGGPSRARLRRRSPRDGGGGRRGRRKGPLAPHAPLGRRGAGGRRGRGAAPPTTRRAARPSGIRGRAARRRRRRRRRARRAAACLLRASSICRRASTPRSPCSTPPSRPSTRRTMRRPPPTTTRRRRSAARASTRSCSRRRCGSCAGRAKAAPPSRRRGCARCSSVVRAFPANRMLLSAFLDARATTHDRFRCRRFLAAACRRHPSCAPLWLCAVRFELGGGASGGGGASAALAPPSGARAAARGARAARERSAARGGGRLRGAVAVLRAARARARPRRGCVPRAAARRPAVPRLQGAVVRRAAPAAPRADAPRQLRDVVQLMPEKEIRLRTDRRRRRRPPTRRRRRWRRRGRRGRRWRRRRRRRARHHPAVGRSSRRRPRRRSRSRSRTRRRRRRRLARASRKSASVRASVGAPRDRNFQSCAAAA